MSSGPLGVTGTNGPTGPSAAVRPLVLSNPVTVASIKVEEVLVTLFKGAEVFVELLDASGKTVKRTGLQMTESEYASWGTSDTFVVQWAARKLGLTLA